MSMEENKALIRRYFQKIDEGDLTVIDDFVAPDFVDHSTSPGSSPDRDGLKQGAAGFLAAVPDGYHKVEDLVAEGDRVVARVRGYGTHLGELMGVPATGKMVTATGIVIWRIADGKIVERWSVLDALGLMRQLQTWRPDEGPSSGLQASAST